MRRLHIRNWAWLSYGIPNPIAPGIDLACDTAGGTAILNLPGWTTAIIFNSREWQAVSAAGEELHAAISAALGEEVAA